MLSESQQEHEKVEKQLQSELQGVKRYYHVLKSGLHHVVEQTVPTYSFKEILSKFNKTQKMNLLSYELWIPNCVHLYKLCNHFDLLSSTACNVQNV